MASFRFTFQPEKKFLEDATIRDYLQKWSMAGRLSIQCFSFDQHYKPYNKEDFVLSPEVVSNLLVATTGNLASVGKKATSVTARDIRCTQLSMAFFDRMETLGVTRGNGQLAKCLDTPVGDFIVSDKLREMLLLEESELYSAYNAEERDEFLFRLLRHLALGGALCQYEETLVPYLDTARDLYKQLVSVSADPATRELRITSHVLEVTASDENGQYYPSSAPRHENTFAYCVIDPQRRIVSVLSHCFGFGAL